MTTTNVSWMVVNSQVEFSPMENAAPGLNSSRKRNQSPMTGNGTPGSSHASMSALVAWSMAATARMITAMKVTFREDGLDFVSLTAPIIPHHGRAGPPGDLPAVALTRCSPVFRGSPPLSAPPPFSP